MTRKFVRISGFVVQSCLLAALAGVSPIHAQDAPAQQPSTPQTQQQPAQPTGQAGSQEATPEETIPMKRKKPKGFDKWTFNAGGGGSLTNGNTQHFVRGGGGIGAFGVARNGGRYVGLRLDFHFDNLPLRSSALQAAQAPGATDHAYTLMLDPIINIPASKVWGGYVLGGATFLHRSGKLDSSSAIPGSACNNFFLWWGHCFAASLPINGNFLHSSLNQFGENFGGGITRKITPKFELYGEFRYVHAKSNGITTDFRPITVGLRW